MDNFYIISMVIACLISLGIGIGTGFIITN